MGSLTYDGWTVEFEDRMLAHLQLVIIQRFRNEQSFAMSWINSVDDGNGRGSIWLHPGVLLAFRFSGSRGPTINEDWIRRLTASAESSQGLIVTGEDGQLGHSLGIRRT